jgi:lipopolysaccharide export system protein LptA
MLRPCCRNSLLIIASFLLLAAKHEKADLAKGPREPIVITSNRMEADELGNKVVFTGKVTLKKETMTLSSDLMTVLYDAGTREVREVQAHGNVVVRKEGRVALANDALYFSADEKIVLTGDARIIENDNQLGGKKITLFMRDDRSIVEGGNVLLYKDKQEKPLENRKRK